MKFSNLGKIKMYHFPKFQGVHQVWGTVENNVKVVNTCGCEVTVETSSKSLHNFLVPHLEKKELQSIHITIGIFAIGIKFSLTCSYI